MAPHPGWRSRRRSHRIALALALKLETHPHEHLFKSDTLRRGVTESSGPRSPGYVLETRLHRAGAVRIHNWTFWDGQSPVGFAFVTSDVADALPAAGKAASIHFSRPGLRQHLVSRRPLCRPGALDSHGKPQQARALALVARFSYACDAERTRSLPAKSPPRSAQLTSVHRVGFSA